MKKADVKVGSTYVMKHTSGMIHARILREKAHRCRGHWSGNDRTTTHWIAVNLKTGREIEIKSAAKLIREVQPA